MRLRGARTKGIGRILFAQFQRGCCQQNRSGGTSPWDVGKLGKMTDALDSPSKRQIPWPPCVGFVFRPIFLVLKEKPVLGTNIVACRLRSPENGKPHWQEADFASPFSAFTYSCKAGPKHLFLKMSTKVDCLSPAARRSGRATNRFLTL